MFFAASEALAVCPGELKCCYVITKRAMAVMIFPVDIVGDGSTNGYELCPGGYRKRPSSWNEKALYVCKENARLAR
jgi:hypothetical protein